MSSRRSSGKESHWRKVIRRHASSGLSVRQFCAKEGIAEPSFYSWRRELRSRDRQDKKRQATSAKSVAVSHFIPVEITAGNNVLELIHPRGYQLRIPANFDAASLQQVLSVLDKQQVVE